MYLKSAIMLINIDRICRNKNGRYLFKDIILYIYDTYY